MRSARATCATSYRGDPRGPYARLPPGRVQPLAHRRVMREVLARGNLVAQLAEHAEALGDDVVLVNRLEVLLARRHERLVLERRVLADHAADHLAHAVLDEPRPPVGLLDDGAL